MTTDEQRDQGNNACNRGLIACSLLRLVVEGDAGGRRGVNSLSGR